MLTEEVKIHGVEDDTALWHVQPNIEDMFAGKIAAAQQYDIEFRAMRRQVIAYSLNVRMMIHFDPPFLQITRVRGNVCQIIRDKGDSVAKLTKELEDLKHPQRA